MKDRGTKKRLARRCRGAIALAICCLISISVQAQTPKGHRLPNVAVGIHHHHPDSALCSPLNIGLLSEVDTLHGFQYGTFLGAARGRADGFMLATLANVAHAFNGVQLSSFNNIVFTPMKGLQLSPITNIAMGVRQGMQFSTIANISSGRMRGLQLSTYNYADTLRGTQIGIINVAQSHPRGVQIGLFNYTRDPEARKIGLVNINPQTRIDVMPFIGTSTRLNLALRFRNAHTYTMIGVGSHFLGLDEDFSGELFYRMGRYWTLAPRWTLGGDVGFGHVETFQDKGDTPRRMYSLQARVTADYAINDNLGAFVAAGYGTTRRYGSNTNFRSRAIIEAGLALRYHHDPDHQAQWEEERLRDREFMLGKLALTPEDSLYRWSDPSYTKKRWWRAAAEAAGINVFVHCFDRFVMDEDFAQVTFKSIAHNWHHAFVWDNDQFSTNLFAHPYHGNLYFNSARSNGLNFWQSAPYALGGSLMWEFCGEVEPPAINDVLATTFGGICIGEVMHRVSALVLNDRTRGFRRFLREAAAFVTNPMQGLNRLIDGDAWIVRQDRYMYHDFSRIPVEFAMSVGDRYLADQGGIFRGENQPYLTFNLLYGDAFDDSNTQPYDYFTLNFSAGFTGNQPLINNLHLLGKLWSHTVYDGKQGKTIVGIFQHFNYYDSKPVKDGSDKTPYRISEAASFGPGMMWQFPQVGNLKRLEQAIFADLILLGGTKSDYYNVIDRDYNMGSGFSLKSKTQMFFPRLGYFSLLVDYYHIYTWKGYEGKDLEHTDPLYLNAQGDRGDAQLLVFSPKFVFQLKNNIGIEWQGAYYGRYTYYKYHPNVRAHTFETRLGLLYRF